MFYGAVSVTESSELQKHNFVNTWLKTQGISQEGNSAGNLSQWLCRFIYFLRDVLTQWL